ncbi:MAG: putative Zn-dependent peptidase, partial [Ignavibacteria bacterium]
MFDRSQAPIEAAKIQFQLPQIENFTLANGIEVYFVQKKNLPIVYLTSFGSAGSRFDKTDKLGTAYLTSLLIDEGAGEFNALQLNDEFEKLGTNFSVSVNPDTIGFSMLSISENFSNSLSLFCKVLTSPRFEQPDFEREKKKVLDRILQLKDEAGYIASSVFEKLLFKNSFYEFPEIGYNETVKNITNDDIKYFYQNRFGTNDVKFFIVG